MNTLQLREAIDEGRVSRIVICSASIGPWWEVLLVTSQGESYMERARGGRAYFRSIDAAHSAVRTAGWIPEVRIQV